MNSMRFLIAGGCGFTGSAIVRQLLASAAHEAVTVDKMIYAASEEALGAALTDPRHHLIRADIADAAAMRAAFEAHRPDIVMNLAAESHVDRSIHGPRDFIDTNITGTFGFSLPHWQDATASTVPVIFTQDSAL